MRMIAVFEKGERVRHIGHLDIQRAVQRGLRRSGLPVAYSNGFSPHILVTFASALSTGAWGSREIMDVTMAEKTSPEEFLSRMNAAMPPEMRLSSAKQVDDRYPALMARLKAASYTIYIDGHDAFEKMSGVLEAFMKRPEIPAERKTKTGVKPCDIRPLIYELAKAREPDALCCLLALTESAACKPGMLIKALSGFSGLAEAPRVLVERTGLFGRAEDGRFVPLETL